MGISGGVTLAVGVKDIPPHLVRGGADAYIPRLRHIATEHVLFGTRKTNEAGS